MKDDVLGFAEESRGLGGSSTQKPSAPNAGGGMGEADVDLLSISSRTGLGIGLGRTSTSGTEIGRGTAFLGFFAVLGGGPWLRSGNTKTLGSDGGSLGGGEESGRGGGTGDEGLACSSELRHFEL